ncbi:MAG: carboxypeptidase M32 [Candidatus Methylacidiphilales bacterium]
MNHSALIYGQLKGRARENSLLNNASSLLQWDQEIMMPAKGSDYRADQLALLSGWAHQRWTDPEVKRWLDEVSVEDLSCDEQVNVERWRYDLERSRRIPADLVEESARLESQAHEAWKMARSRSEFDLFKPYLVKLVACARRKADLWGYELEPYDALLEGHEPGLTSAQLRALFTPLATDLACCCEKAFAMTKSPGLPEVVYPIERQVAFNRRIVEALGYDFSRGRMDVSVHPFSSTLGPQDHRITTRYDEKDFTGSLFGALHEAGHALYEQGLPPEAFGTPLGSSVSLGIHESQSRFWENQIGRSTAFWEYGYPVACEYFPELSQITMEDVVAYVNRVERSFIRVDASEIGYDLHVILRFEVEDRLFNGDLDVEDVPSFWNERFKAFVGLEVPDDARGCLQDIHWSMGGFGYFPTYTLGSLNAAQLYAAADIELGGLSENIALGNYEPLLSWLRKQIHTQGRRYLPGALMEAATGRAPSAEPFLKYIREKVNQLVSP